MPPQPRRLPKPPRLPPHLPRRQRHIQRQLLRRPMLLCHHQRLVKRSIEPASTVLFSPQHVGREHRGVATPLLVRKLGVEGGDAGDDFELVRGGGVDELLAAEGTGVARGGADESAVEAVEAGGDAAAGEKDVGGLGVVFADEAAVVVGLVGFGGCVLAAGGSESFEGAEELVWLCGFFLPGWRREVITLPRGRSMRREGFRSVQ